MQNKNTAQPSASADIIRISKFLSYVLRHRPDEIGLTLDAEGWVSGDELIAKAAASGKPLTRETLDRVVATNDKKRFTFSVDGQRIRAAQGHSVEVALGLTPIAPPDVLYHGTATRFLESILAEGLKPGRRQQVHLSAEMATAVKVGQRHGKPAVLTVDAKSMYAGDFAFYQADNGVWLTDHVPVVFLTVVDA